MIETFEDLLDPTVAILAATSGLAEDRIIPADEGRGPPQPETQLYATYALIPIRAYGQPRKSRELIDALEDGPTPDWEDMAETLITSIELMVSVNFYNEGAAEKAWSILGAEYREDVIKLLHDHEVAWRYASEVRRVPAIVQAGVEQRFQLDLHWFVNTAFTQDVLRAAGVEIRVEEQPSGAEFTIDAGEEP